MLQINVPIIKSNTLQNYLFTRSSYNLYCHKYTDMPMQPTMNGGYFVSLHCWSWSDEDTMHPSKDVNYWTLENDYQTRII